MKLKDYFQNKQEFQLSEDHKLALYEKIISQQKKRNFSRTFKIKYFAYGLITLVLLFGIYGVYFNFDGDISGVAIQNGITNQANADYIAKVVDFNGTFYVQRDGKNFRTSNISNGDNIILRKDSEMIFEIDSGTKAKLTGPARFSIKQDETGYQLFISEGDFIQMESSQEDSAAVEISVGDFKVSSDTHTNILITKSDNQYKVNNQGGNIKVTKNGKETEVKNKELVAINENDITLIQNVEQFQVAFAEQKINQTFEIKDTTPENISESLLNELATGNVKIEKTGLAVELGIIDSKKIPTESQTKTILDTLDRTPLMWMIEDMWKSKQLGDEKAYIAQKNQLDKKIQTLYKEFNIKNPNVGTKEDIQTLIASLQEMYHMPDYQIDRLKVLVNWIDYLDAMKPYEIKSTQSKLDDIDDELVKEEIVDKEQIKLDIENMRLEFEKNIPDNLIIK